MILKSLACGLCATLGLSMVAQSPVVVNVPTATPTNVEHPQWSRNAVIYEVNLRQYSAKGLRYAVAAPESARR
jgi:hypothetical protein